jgi:nucleotide-binding universal stress UspA family protein
MATMAPQAALALRNILIATDFSSCSERALLHAVAVAHRFGSTLNVVHVVRPVMFAFCAPEGYMGVPEAEAQAMDLARHDARKMLSRVLRRTHCEDVKCVTRVQLGIVGETLSAIIEREHIDLAVVGTHAKTGLRHLVMGSVAEDVFRHAPCPVLSIGPYSWRAEPQSVQLKHIVFPTDLSADSLRAVPFVKGIAAEFGASLTVMNVVPQLNSAAAADKPRVLAAIEERLRDMMNVGGPWTCVTNFSVTFGDVVDEVLETARRSHADLIAFGLKAPDYYADRLPWMHAYDLICQAECPVLSLRGPSGRDRWQPDR